VAVPRARLFAAGLQARARKLADQLQHLDAGARAAGDLAHQALAAQGFEQIEHRGPVRRGVGTFGQPDDGFRRGQGTRSGEDCELPERPLLRRRQQIIAPGNRGGQRLLLRRQIPRAPGEQG
jgi:hypothetical protein